MDETSGAAAQQPEPVPPAEAEAGTETEAVDDDGPAPFRLGYVPGVTPAKWARVWGARLPQVRLELVQVAADDAERALRDGELDAAIARPPVDRDVMSVISLYEEQAVVCVGNDHVVAALGDDEQVSLDDLADDVVLHPEDDVLWGDVPLPGIAAVARPATTADALELVAAGVGVLVTPKSLARLHHRKDVTHREADGAPSAPVGLVWPSLATTDLVDEMIGIVRGRTANSSRGRRAAEAVTSAPVARPAKEGNTGAGGPGGARSGKGSGAGAGKTPVKGGAKGKQSVASSRRNAAAKRAAAGKRARRQGR
ncbi:LysR family transcriptional regulator [Paraoerskovia sediminicola]|uniref:LysR family transcriptional regulator n=1 Tax=Paraoerskovia sediminicola TaxID=1138587 RepID=A0ABN6XDK6_9CELL|nr:LysR substrate-binding domain-containing protein [Paraoerskovia sediminicola]BDZ42775.1 LysR family transcriptional regulator [Paraoerskovia sediminicola]